jgi:nitrogen regulatory protein P-II 1
MTRITCIIRPHRLEQVKTAIANLGVTGINVADVRGSGNSPERSDWFSGKSTVIPLPVKSLVEVVAHDSMADAIVEAILKNARTGEPGDGKIIVERVADAIRIRTGERGDAAI